MIAYNTFLNADFDFEDAVQIDSSFEDILDIKKAVVSPKEYTLSGLEMQILTRDVWFSKGEVLSEETQTAYKWIFRVKDIVSFSWQDGQKTIHYEIHGKGTTLLLKFWLLHTVLPIYFSTEETYNILHASCVEVEGKAIAFIAEPYGGKSTLADFFIQQRHTFLSDDTLATFEKEDKIFSVASYPYHRPYRKMEDLGYRVKNIADKPKILHAIYTLEKGKPEDEIIIKELFGIEKFKVLHLSRYVKFSSLKIDYFKSLNFIAQSIPIFQIKVPWTKERLPEIYAAIVKHNNNF